MLILPDPPLFCSNSRASGRTGCDMAWDIRAGLMARHTAASHSAIQTKLLPSDWWDIDTMITKWGPQTIAKLVNITPITMVYGRYNYSIYGVYFNQRSHHWGAPPTKNLVGCTVHHRWGAEPWIHQDVQQLVPLFVGFSPTYLTVIWPRPIYNQGVLIR